MDIKIRIGKTRIVVICGSFAYKIVRFRLYDLLCKWVKLEYEKRKYDNKTAYVNVKRHTRKQLITDMLIACFRANYTEHEHWRRCPNADKFVPTLFTFFYLINIQERDEVARDYSNKFISSAHNRKCGDYLLGDDSLHIDNFTVAGRLLDYGGVPLEP